MHYAVMARNNPAGSAEYHRDMSEGSFGVILPSNHIREALPLAKLADAESVDSLWTIETRLTGDAITPLSVYAANTARIRVGTAGIPIWTRHPALIAQTFATLHALAPGRVVLGLSAWWNPLATRVGLSLNKPVKAMREVIESIRLLLTAEGPVSYAGEFVRLRDVLLENRGDDTHKIRIYVGAVGPQLLRLATRVADGIVLNGGHTVAVIRREVEVIRQEAMKVGRPFDEIEILKMMRIRVDNNKERAIAGHKPDVARYIAEQAHIARSSEADPGLVARLRSMMSWPSSESEAVRAAELIPDSLVESLGCYGDRQEVRYRIREYMAAGITMPLLLPDNITYMRRAVDLMLEGW